MAQAPVSVPPDKKKIAAALLARLRAEQQYRILLAIAAGAGIVAAVANGQ